MMEHEYWWEKLTLFDVELFRMVETLTGKKCEPKNGGNDRYFLVVNYSGNPDPDFINAVWDAVAGRVGERLIELTDHPEDYFFTAYIKFYSGIIPEMLFIPIVDLEYYGLKK